MPSAVRRFFAWNRASAAGGGGGEPAVDRLRIEAVRDQPELERGDIPADGSDAELALPEEGSSEGPERRTASSGQGAR